ncbi:MAG: PAS domain S-box protein [Candidatus Omnitrophica bacterium]|nr:PAS domain S-box protein [Candidatus Omnitrophota bacterium]
MVEREESRLYSEWLRQFATALSQMRLYSENHPILLQSLHSLMEETKKLFLTQSSITVGFAPGRFIIDEIAFAEKDVKAPDVIEKCQALGIDAFELKKEVNIAELQTFLSLLAIRPKELESKGGFRKIFEEAGLKNVKVISGRYAILKENETVTSDRAKKRIKVTSVKELIEISKEAPSDSLDLDREKLAEEIAKDVSFVTKLILRSAQTPEELKGIQQRLEGFFTTQMIPQFVESGKDFPKVAEKMASEYQKTLAQPGIPEGFKSVGAHFTEFLEKCADQARIQILVKAHEGSPEDPKPLQQWAKKFLKDEKVRVRIKSPLKEKLLAKGLSGETFESLFETLEEEIPSKTKKREVEPKPQKGKTLIEESELKELREKAKQFEEFEKKHRLVETEKNRILAEKERVDTVIRNLAEGLVVVDNAGKVLLMNPAAEKLLGIEEHNKAVGTELLNNIKEEHLLAITKGALRDQGGKVAKEIEVRSPREDTKRILQASSAVIENEDGGTVGMVSVLSDITKQKELDALKEKFVSSVSHELRSPLIAIQKSLNLLLGGEAGEVKTEQKEYLSIASRNIERLSHLINDLLDLSRVEAGKLELRPSNFQLAPLVHHIKETFKTWAQDKKVEIKEGIEDEALTMEADPDRLTQVITNLFGNALKFTPEGGTITIQVRSVKNKALGPDAIEISVKDTGIGITEKDQKRIFDKFEQVSLTQPAGVSSTGLGLTIAKEIVELHGGRIWVESEEGKGSCFSFVLPKKFQPAKK